MMALRCQAQEGGTILLDFERLLLLDLEHLIPAHGSVKYDGAKQALRETLALDIKEFLSSQ